MLLRISYSCIFVPFLLKRLISSSHFIFGSRCFSWPRYSTRWYVRTILSRFWVTIIFRPVLSYPTSLYGIFPSLIWRIQSLYLLHFFLPSFLPSSLLVILSLSLSAFLSLFLSLFHSVSVSLSYSLFLSLSLCLSVSLLLSVSVSLYLSFSLSLTVSLSLSHTHTLSLSLSLILSLPLPTGELVYNLSLKETVFLVFDVLAVEGRACLQLPFSDRQKIIRCVQYLRIKLFYFLSYPES